jgi:serine/threonine protein kinase/WD40 repeat protein
MSNELNDPSIPQPPPEAADAAYPSLQELAYLLPQYEMHDIIGVGGMGAVYKARQAALDRWVAIKVLPIAAAESDEATQRFIKEARSMAKLVHPHIVAVFDFGQTHARHLFLVMEYVEGQDLHLRTRAGEITPQRAREVIAQLCDALQFAHDRGVAHRDIKPANILITNDWKVKVADFGLARDLTAQPNADEPEYGTPDYTAPERFIVGAVVDHRADIYSLGVVIHEMLTGKTPTAAGKDASKGLPDGFADVISKCLIGDPEERYQKASEVKIALLTATAEKQQQTNTAKKTGPAPREKIEPPESYTSYRPSAFARLARLLGPIGWGLACMLLVGVFTWLMLKDKVSIEVAKNDDAPEKTKVEEPVKPSEPTPDPAPVEKAPPMVATKVTQDMAEPVIQLPDAPAYTVPDGSPGEVAHFHGHRGPAYSLKLLKDQRRVVSVSMDATLRVWDVATQKELLKVDPEMAQISRMQLSADESIAVLHSAQTDKVALIELASGKVLHTARYPNDQMYNVALSADGKTVLASGKRDDVSQDIMIWKPQTGGSFEPVSIHQGRIYAMTLTPDGRDFIITGSELSDAATKTYRPYAVSYSTTSGQFTKLDSSALGYITRFFAEPGATMTYTVGSSPKVVSLPDLSLIKALPSPPREGPSALAGKIVDRNRLMFTSWSDSSLRAYEVSSGDEVWRTTLSEPVTDITVSRDERWAVLSTRYKDSKKQQDGTSDLILWRLPKWATLISKTATDALITTQMADLAKHDPELAALRLKLRESFAPTDAKEIAEQRQKLDALYINALRREIPGRSPTEQNAIKQEVDLITLGNSLPNAGMDVSLSAILLKNRTIYRQQLTTLLEKQKVSAATSAKSVESYLTPLRQKREAAGDSIGIALVAAVLKEWQQTESSEPKSDTPQSAASAGTPTKRPDRAGSVFSIQRTALNTSPITPPPEVNRVPRSLGPVVAIAGGEEHVFALLPDGSLRAWGQWDGSPVSAPSAATDVVQIDSTGSAALALRGDGKVIAWSPSTVENATTWQASDGKATLSVHAGTAGSGYALCTDGSIQNVGSGDPTPPTGLGPVAKLFYIPTTLGWCAILRDGTPVYWGMLTPPVTPLPTNMRDLVGISIASGYGVALQRDGTMTGWGQLAQDQRYRTRKFTGGLEVLHDYAGRVFAVHRSDHSWELAPNPNIPEYVSEDRSSFVEGRLRGSIDAVFTREYVIGLKP